MSATTFSGTVLFGLSSEGPGTPLPPVVSFLDETPEWPTIIPAGPGGLPVIPAGSGFENAPVASFSTFETWNPNPPNPNFSQPLPPEFDFLNTLPPLEYSGVSRFQLPPFTETTLSSVPEPSTIALVMLGCSAAALSKRFRKKKTQST